MNKQNLYGLLFLIIAAPFLIQAGILTGKDLKANAWFEPGDPCDQYGCPPSSTPPPPTITPPPVGGGGGGCEAPQIIDGLWIDGGIPNDGKLTLHWNTKDVSSMPDVDIKYWKNTTFHQTIRTANDGGEEITGLTNGVHYWLAIKGLNSCGDGTYSTPIDPLP